jgi:hypothetical protein
MSRHTIQEGRELRKRLENVRAKGGVAQAEVERRMRARIARDLRRLVATYTGTARQARELLATLAAAREVGVSCDGYISDLASRIRKPARAA